MTQNLAFAKELAKYTDKWVALEGKRVVASGNSVRQVQEKVARKKITDFAFHSVPSRRLAMAVKVPIHLDAARWFATILEI